MDIYEYLFYVAEGLRFGLFKDVEYLCFKRFRYKTKWKQKKWN